MEAITKNSIITDSRIKISLLWIVVMFNMVFADIVGFLNPGTLEEMMAMKPNQGMLLVFSVLIEIPIAMIFLSWVLKPKINRWVNIITSIITILWVIGGGTASASYIFFATVEVTLMIYIISIAWKMNKQSEV